MFGNSYLPWQGSVGKGVVGSGQKSAVPGKHSRLPLRGGHVEEKSKGKNASGGKKSLWERTKKREHSV